MKLINIVFLFVVLLCVNNAFSQQKFSDSKTVIEYYGALTHQHHNFYNKPFSYTGIEAGIILNHYFLAGLYGSTFLSVLETGKIESTSFLQMRQSGLVFGIMTKNTTRIHGGILLNAGYIAISTGNEKFSLFNSGDKTNINGFVLVPQIYGETNLTRWMRFRTGIAYDFYDLNKKNTIALSKIRDVSANFGLVFGYFRNCAKWF